MLRRRTRSILLIAITALLAAGTLLLRSDHSSEDESASSEDPFSPLHLLAASDALQDERFPQVPSSWQFTFPADHGAHREYRTESWQVAGLLTPISGLPLGVQLLLVRIGLRAEPAQHRSAWAASEIYGAFFSISSFSGERLHTSSRLGRGALGLAGATINPVQIWVEDWRFQQFDIDDEAINLRMQVRGDTVELDLELRNTQPLLRGSELGEVNSRRSAPFQFYLQPRMSALGTVLLDGERRMVNGTLSFEHAWGELPLPVGAVASDRFTLHLDDERELLLVRTHRADGTGVATTTGLLLSRTTPPRPLSDSDVDLTPVTYWTSPRTGATYPIEWHLRIPTQGIDVELVPYWKDQEGTEWLTFWAGPVRLQGTARSGQGLIQLYAYDNQ